MPQPADAGDPGDPAEPGDLLALAVDLAAEAAALLAARLQTVRETVETKSSLTDMVTEVDRDTEALVVGRLRAERPGDGVLGEEGAAHDGTTGVRWIIDPLDGTTNYLYGFPAFAVSIAAEVDGEVVAGVVHDAVHGEAFRAVRGGGAFVGARPIAVSDKAQLATALIGTGFGYAAERRAQQAAWLAHVLPRVRDVRRAGSAALDLCWVACGRLDGFYELGLQPWDRAAGQLLVTEAGGRTTILDDGTVVAAGPALFEPLRDLVLAAQGAPAGPAPSPR